MQRLLLTTTLAALAACSGSHADRHIATVTKDAKQAFKEWCSRGDLEVGAKLDTPVDNRVKNDPNLLMMDCKYTTSLDDPNVEYGEIVFDTKTDQLIHLIVILHPSTARGFLNRVLAPGLDAEQQAALDDLLVWLRAKGANARESNVWRDDTMRVVGHASPPVGHQPEGQWSITAAAEGAGLESH